MHRVLPTTMIPVPLMLALACSRGGPAVSSTDSAFKALQERGAAVMGVDQYTSRHVFEDLPDGGRIVLVRENPGDTAGVRIIRAHFRQIADSFGRGIFRDPSLVHDREVPGTREMSRLKDRIQYAARDRVDGGELLITTRDPDAVAAIHSFLAFQRGEHHAAGHEGMMH